jgi:hypothetical protein
MPTTYLLRDEEVTDPMGQGVSGVSIYLCSQPATTSSIPPSPLAQIYSDPAGKYPITQPVVTDAYGHAEYYTSPGIYTCVYYSTQIAGLTFVLTDQIIAPSSVQPQYNSDTTAIGTILPNNPNDIEVAFTLSATPVPGSLILMVNGLVQYAYAFSGSTVIFETAPLTGDVITATYQVS